MSDLISRELLIDYIDNNFRSYWDYQTVAEVFNIIANAPVVSAEPVIDKAAYDGAREDLSIWKRRALEAEEKVRKYDQRIVDIGVIAMTPVTTPQQSQSVADALEEAAKIMRTTLTGRCWETDIQMAEHAIRNLIKRDAKAVE